MTDKKWQLVIKQCQNAGIKHIKLLKIAEDEYIKRYGHNPSEVYDDWWIDRLHYCTGNTNLQKIKDSAEFHCNER